MDQDQDHFNKTTQAAYDHLTRNLRTMDVLYAIVTMSMRWWTDSGKSIDEFKHCLGEAYEGAYEGTIAPRPEPEHRVHERWRQ